MQKHPSPLYLTTFEKVGFALLYQSGKSSTNKKPANYPKTRRKPIFFALTKGGCTKKRRPIPDAFFTGFPLIAGVTRAFK